MGTTSQAIFEKLWAALVKWLVGKLDLDHDGVLTWKDAKIAMAWIEAELDKAATTIPGWADMTLMQKLQAMYDRFMAQFKGFKDWSFLLLEVGAWIRLKLKAL